MIKLIQVKNGRFDTLVNKFMGLCRLYGIIFALVSTIDLGVLRDRTMEEENIWYCSVLVFIRDFLSLCFWSNQIIMAIIR
jgi:hypothetical protein